MGATSHDELEGLSSRAVVSIGLSVSALLAPLVMVVFGIYVLPSDYGDPIASFSFWLFPILIAIGLERAYKCKNFSAKFVGWSVLLFVLGMTFLFPLLMR